MTGVGMVGGGPIPGGGPRVSRGIRLALTLSVAGVLLMVAFFAAMVAMAGLALDCVVLDDDAVCRDDQLTRTWGSVVDAEADPDLGGYQFLQVEFETGDHTEQVEVEPWYATDYEDGDAIRLVYWAGDPPATVWLESDFEREHAALGDPGTGEPSRTALWVTLSFLVAAIAVGTGGGFWTARAPRRIRPLYPQPAPHFGPMPPPYAPGPYQPGPYQPGPYQPVPPQPAEARPPGPGDRQEAAPPGTETSPWSFPQ